MIITLFPYVQKGNGRHRRYKKDLNQTWVKANITMYEMYNFLNKIR